MDKDSGKSGKKATRKRVPSGSVEVKEPGDATGASTGKAAGRQPPEIRAFRRAPETKFRGRAPIVKAFDAVPYEGVPLSPRRLPPSPRGLPPSPARQEGEGPLRGGEHPLRGGKAHGAGEVFDAAPEPKWRRRADARPDEILDAALEAFTEQGFEATPVDDVARRAGISKAGLYLYFESKEALLRALIEREIAPFARLTRSLAEQGRDDPETTIGGIVAAMTSILSNPRMFAAPRLVLSVAPRFPEIGAYYREHVVEEALGAIASLIEAGVERGVFRPVDSRLAARAVMGPLLLHAMWTHVLGGSADAGSPEARARAQLDLLLQGIAS